jgi:vacuolar protein sorting-associated protein 13A/C
MVFESIVSYFLEKYLSNYLDNFDSSKLKIGIWSGDVVLENLQIKPNALVILSCSSLSIISRL